MFAEFYGLSGKPFQLTPDPHFYFDSSTHHKAMSYLTYGISQGEGFIIITGEIGAGKTTLVGHLLEELDKEQFVAAKIVTTHLDADDILKMVAAGFGLNIEATEKSVLIQRIQTFLERNYRKGKRALLIVDEAQNLPTRALEELRMLSNFQAGDHALLQSFLVGQPEFRDKWAFDPDLEQLRQRVIATHHLQSMTHEETKEYIIHRLSLVGWKGNPEFTEGAFQGIYDFTHGVPRKLNTLCSRLLLFGAIEERHTIDEQVVRDVIGDMEQDNRAAGNVRSVSVQPAPIVGGRPQNGQVRTVAVADPDLEKRLAVLEEAVQSHDMTIKHALGVASAWLGGKVGSGS